MESERHHRTPASRPTVCSTRSTASARGDGRLLALNSYENRVYQVWIDDGPPVVAKFYRPGRWTDAQILEEHAFVAELADREIPVVAALSLAGDAHAARVRRLPLRRLSASAAAARPSSKTARRSNGWAASSGACTRSARLRPFVVRPALDIASFGEEPRAYLLAHGFIPEDLRPAYERRRPGARRRAPLRRARRRRARPAPARRLPRRQRAVDRRRPALRRLRRLPDRSRGAGPVDAACPATGRT